jgi:hypothetical protein
MSNPTQKVIIQIKRAASSTWSQLNWLLEEGELGLEMDTRRIKIGTGATQWNDLPYSLKQTDNLLLDGNTISSVDSNGDIELAPDGSGKVVVYSDLFVDGEIYSQGDKRVATEEYVNSVKQVLDVKDSVRAATLSAIMLAGIQTVDGVQLSAGDRVLVKNQNSVSENGIYSVSSGMWSRSEDANSNLKVTPGLFVFVEEGDSNANSGWVLSSEVPIALGQTAIIFSQFSGAGQITAGAGLTKNGNQIDAVGTAGRILVESDSIDISPDYEGQTSISVLGVVSVGTWRGTAVEASHGGTGISEFSPGDILYAGENNILLRLSAGNGRSFLKMNADGTAPEWSNVIDGGTP